MHLLTAHSFLEARLAFEDEDPISSFGKILGERGARKAAPNRNHVVSHVIIRIQMAV
jgi:hypothetical protein